MDTRADPERSRVSLPSERASLLQPCWRRPGRLTGVVCRPGCRNGLQWWIFERRCIRRSCRKERMSTEERSGFLGI